MKRAIRLVVLAMVLGGLVWGGYWAYQNRAASAATTEAGSYTQVVTVERGSLTSGLSVVGQLEAVLSADLTFEEMSGTAQVVTVAAVAGQRVAAGDVLATIDATPYEQALEQAQNDLLAAEESLAELEAPATALEIGQADVAVSQAQVELQAAEAALEDLSEPDIAALQSAVSNARIALAQAEADLAELQDGSGEEELAALREADATAWAVYSDWAAKVHSDSDAEYPLQLLLAYNKMMNAQDKLATAEAEAQVSLLQAQIAVRSKQQALAMAQEALVDGQAGGDALELASAGLAVSRAEVALQAAQEARAELEEGADASELAAARAEVEKLQLAVSEAEAALEGCELTAPFDGTVLETYVSAGDAVAASTAIMTVADLATLRVIASVDETTIREVSVGQSAAISFDAYPNQTFPGEVLSIPLQGTLQGDVTVYEVVLSLTGAEELGLLVGMTANVEIEVGQADDAVLVPTLALSEVNGQYQVLVPNRTDPAGEPETVVVEVGLSDGTYTQILSGLEAGDQVVVQLDSSTATESEGAPAEMGGPGGTMGQPPSGSPPAAPGG